MMGFFRSSYDAGRRVFPWILAGAAIFGTYKYSQYKADRERDLLSRLGRLEEDSQILRTDYLERREQEAGLKKRLGDELGDIEKRFKEMVETHSKKSREEREGDLRERAEARRAYGEFEAEFRKTKDELAKVQWPPARIEVVDPIYPGFKGTASSKEVRAGKARLLVEKMKNLEQPTRWHYNGLEKVLTIRNFDTNIGDLTLISIDWRESNSGYGPLHHILIIGSGKKNVDHKDIINNFESNMETGYVISDGKDATRHTVDYLRPAFEELIIDPQRDGDPDLLVRKGADREVDPNVLNGVYEVRLDACLRVLDPASIDSGTAAAGSTTATENK